MGRGLETGFLALNFPAPGKTEASQTSAEQGERGGFGDTRSRGTGSSGSCGAGYAVEIANILRPIVSGESVAYEKTEDLRSTDNGLGSGEIKIKDTVNPCWLNSVETFQVAANEMRCERYVDRKKGATVRNTVVARNVIGEAVK